MLKLEKGRGKDRKKEEKNGHRNRKVNVIREIV